MRYALVIPLLISSSTFAFSAQAERPAFQAPFPCGQVWRASTYEGHGSNAIDLVQRDSALSIIGEYQPAMASAAGTVTLDYTWPSGSKKDERWVVVDHGDGWRTHYFHLEEEDGKPRLAVGRKVAMGEILGRTSNSGANAVHIHYAQMKDITREGNALNTLANAGSWGTVLSDGDKIRTRFNGRAIDTYLANEDSWGHFSSDESEKIRSFNCPAGRFARWASGGNHFILRHHPGNGNMRINLVGPTNGNNPLQLNRTDRSNWNLIVPFYSAANNQAHMLQYDFASGKAQFARISPGYDGLTVLKTHSIYPGWTEMVPIRIGGKPHVVSYDSRYGWFNVDQLNALSDGFVSRLKTKVRTGFTNLVPYEEGPRRYMLMYSGSTGELVVQKLTRNPDQSVKRERVHTENRAKGFTHMALLQHRGQRHLLGYNSATGRARVWQVKRNGQGLEAGARLTWQAGWTSITPYLHNSRAHVLAYRASDGLTRKVRLKDDLSGFDHLFSENWATGYR